MNAEKIDSPRVVIAVLAAAMILPFARAHIHDWDASVYTVISRHLVADLSPWRLRYLSHLWPEFYEHPPLFFMINATFIALIGESALPWLNGLAGIATVLLMFDFLQRRASTRAAIAAALVLLCTESFFRYQARVKIDPWLTLFMTASVFALVERRVLLGGLFCGLALLTKGPPALVCPVVAAAWVLNETRAPGAALRVGVVGLTAALVLPGLCLWADARYLGGAWARGYLGAQIFASMGATRADPAFTSFTMTGHLIARFWPGLPLTVLGLWSSRSIRTGLFVWSAAIVVGLSLPSRGFWWSLTPAFVPLSMLAGLGFEKLPSWSRLERIPVRRWATVALVFAAVTIGTAWPRLIMRPCPLGDLPALADARFSGGEILLISQPLPEERIHELAAEHVRAPMRYVKPDEPDEPDKPDGETLAIVHDSAWPRPGWRVVAVHGEWRLAVRP